MEEITDITVNFKHFIVYYKSDGKDNFLFTSIVQRLFF